MAIAGLWLAPFVHMVPQNPKISKFLWENSQSPAPTWSDLIKKSQPLDRICSLTSPSICKNPHGHSWSASGTVPPQSSPQTQKSRNSYGRIPKVLHQLCQILLKRIAHLIEYTV